VSQGQPSRLPRILIGERRRIFAALVANGLGQALVLVAAALLARACFDRIGGLPEDPSRVAFVAGAAGGLVVAGGLLVGLRTAERAAAERLGQSYLTATRLALFNHVNLVPSRALQTRTRGVMMVRFVADLNALNAWISRGLSRLVVAATTALSALAVLAWLSPEVALSVGLALLAAGGVMAAAGPGLYQRVRAMRRARGRLAANLGEKLVAVSPVQVFGRVRGERARLEEQSDTLARAAVARARRAAFLRSLPDGVLPLATAAVLLVGSLRDEPLSTGTLLAAVLVVNLLAAPLRDLTQAFVFWQTYRAARDVLSDFLALPTLEPRGEGAPRLPRGPGRLAFEAVEVAGSLDGVTAVAEAGALVVVRGASGSGKSTLLALAARLFDPDKGRVVLDGCDLATCDVESVRRAVSMVSADLPLLRGSLRRNLTYRAKDASDDEVAEVLRLCDLEAAVANLPKGLDTRIPEGGASLPAALRHRLLFARAVLGRPRLLLVDDADALGGPDDATAEALARVLSHRGGGATTLVVTENSRWLRMADAVWTLRAGRIEELPPEGSGPSFLATLPVARRTGMAS
jgi:ABC-type multidrug transport system fused ATPase/permease subunit